MTTVHRKSREGLILRLHNGMHDYSNYEDTLSIVQLFETDPLVIEKPLPSFVSALISNYLPSSPKTQLIISKLFYSLCKIFQNKRVRIHIPINIYELPNVLESLSSSQDWQRQYLLLSWLVMLVKSPFKLENDFEILEVVSHLEQASLLRPLVSTIKAELWVKNYEIFEVPDDLYEINPIDLNYMFKVLKHKAVLPLTSCQLETLTNSIIQLKTFQDEIEGLYVLKLLPKLAILLARYNETWPLIYDILFWLTASINLPLTDLRFKLAKSVSKILLFTNSIDPDSSRMVIEDCLSDTITLIETNTSDSMDADRLHTFLLILAEFSRHRLVTIKEVTIMTEKIIPIICKFQQVRMLSTQGHQIRDASNFICWSLSREYQDLPQSCFQQMFLSLLFTANFDYYPLIRKSGMAALQECLGRHGNDHLDNVTVVRLVEIHLGQLSNAKPLYQLLKDNYPEYVDKLIEWLVIYSIGTNFNYPTVKDSILLLKELNDLMDEKLSLLIHNYCDQLLSKGCLKKDSEIASRALLLHCQINPKATRIFMENLGVLQQQPVPKVWNPSVSFKMLSNLKSILVLIKSNITLSKEYVERIFLIARQTQDNDPNYTEISSNFNLLIKLISENKGIFDDSQTEMLFWSTFKKLFLLEHCLISSAAPYLDQYRFLKLFYEVIHKASCEFKAKMIESLSKSVDSFSMTEDFSKFICDVISLLDDYTITTQGDVGRLVRLQTAKFIQNHLRLMTVLDLEKNVENKLLRLVGEPLTEIRLIAYSILCEMKSFSSSKSSFNAKILDLYKTHYDGRTQFWEGYFFSTGAIHSTDKQISSAVDGLISFYQDLDSDSQLRIANEFAKMIPSYTQLNNNMKSHIYTNELGSPLKDIIKVTATYLNSWLRLLESGMKLNRTFNYQGMFAKLYNLQLFGKSASIRTYGLKLLALLVSSNFENNPDGSEGFANEVIAVLLKLIKHKRNNETFSNNQKIAIESLTQIYLSMNNDKKVNMLVNDMSNPEKMMKMNSEAFFL